MLNKEQILKIVRDPEITFSAVEIINAYIFEKKGQDIKIEVPDINDVMRIALMKNLYSTARNYYLNKYKDEP